MKNKFFFAVFLGIMLFTAGCNGPSQAAPKDEGAAVSTTRMNAVTQPAVPEDNSVPASEDIKSEFLSLMGGMAKEYVVSYDTVVSAEGKDNAVKMTYYTKGADRLRVDTIVAGGPMGESRLYKLSDELVVCNLQGTEWNCVKMDGNESSTTPMDALKEFEESVGAADVSRLPDRVIAGVKARCYKTTIAVNGEIAGEMGTGSADYVYCLSNEGVPLYTEAILEGMRMRQEAESYGTSVSDSEFTPPSEPMDMSDLLTRMQAAGQSGVAAPDVSGVADEGSRFIQ